VVPFFFSFFFVRAKSERTARRSFEALHFTLRCRVRLPSTRTHSRRFSLPQGCRRRGRGRQRGGERRVYTLGDSELECGTWTHRICGYPRTPRGEYIVEIGGELYVGTLNPFARCEGCGDTFGNAISSGARDFKSRNLAIQKHPLESSLSLFAPSPLLVASWCFARLV